MFSPKQKELFKKRLEGLPLTKTEQEYYSRSVKKKGGRAGKSGVAWSCEEVVGEMII
jgi:hypothetical protein